MKNGRFPYARILPVLPSVLVFTAFFAVPLAYFFIISFWRVRAFQLRPDATLAQYEAVFLDYSGPLIFTLGMALAIGLTTTLIAFAFAFFCRFRAYRFGTALIFVTLLALFGGYLTKIYMWKTILGSAGILNSALLAIGLIDNPITALLYNPVAVVITLVHYTLPLAVLPIYGSLKGIDDIPLEAARDLGASRMRIFADIIVPQCRVGILSAFSLSFIFAAGDYVTPLMVGGPSSSMIGLFIQNQFGTRLNSPLGSAMSFVVIGCCVVIILTVAAALFAVTRRRD
ncbi:ABC transporter permease [Rhizobiales bacterium]|uniref:ABC transporter permease n=1 Tax=Hongsoonwoonella zoysiae TaxID=2821844 RepID=UPI00155FFE94|nr:ABC transporter permease [Hongsoonwoonella zoysiae]NRG17750.1 ABC transporter permease [Hongsoonwoonella zoysiae]